VPSFVTDTHALIWSLQNDPQLGLQARQIFVAAGRGETLIYVPTICVVEMVYLQEKRRIPRGLITQLDNLLYLGVTGLLLQELTGDIANATSRVSRAEVPDMPDRIIAATALHLGVPLISRDRRISLSAVATVW